MPMIRDKFIEILKSGKSQRQVAKDLKISRCIVQNMWKNTVPKNTEKYRQSKNSKRTERRLIRLLKYKIVSIWTVRDM